MSGHVTLYHIIRGTRTFECCFVRLANCHIVEHIVEICSCRKIESGTQIYFFYRLVASKHHAERGHLVDSPSRELDCRGLLAPLEGCAKILNRVGLPAGEIDGGGCTPLECRVHRGDRREVGIDTSELPIASHRSEGFLKALDF